VTTAALRPAERYRHAYEHFRSTARADESRRRRVAVLVTLPVGMGVSAWALHIPAGDPAFYWATALLAVVWTVGAVASGPLHAGHEPGRTGRPLVSSVVLAAALAAFFCLGGVVVGLVPALREPVLELLDHAVRGNLVLVAVLTAVNGVAEELIHRGAVFAALPARHAVLVSTIVYAVVTATSGIPLLVLAAVALGALTGLLRACTGGIVGPAVLHVTWSMTMLFALGPILRAVS